MTGAALAVAASPCIRCGDCATACPVGLHPQRLLLQLRDGQLHAAEADRALDCTECGRCDTACPSHIPLLERYRAARAAIADMHARERIALAARDRYRARQQRLGRDDDARSERLAVRDADLASADAVAAAIARSQARRAALRQRPKD